MLLFGQVSYQKEKEKKKEKVVSELWIIQMQLVVPLIVLPETNR